MTKIERIMIEAFEKGICTPLEASAVISACMNIDTSDDEYIEQTGVKIIHEIHKLRQTN